MDRKSVLILIASVALIALWQVWLIPKFYPPRPHSTNVVNVATNNSTTNVSTTTVAAATNAISSVTKSEPNASEINTPEKLLVVTNENAFYTFTSHGGG